MPIPETFAELQARGGVMVYLARHRARAEYSRAKLREVGFANIELTEGVDAFATDLRQVAATEGWSFRPELEPGKMGNALAMFRLWRRVVDEHLPYLLIFEDDVLPRPDLTSLGPKYWADTPRDVDFIMLGNQMTVHGDEMTFTPQDADRRVVRALSWTTHAYIVTLEGAHRAVGLLSIPELLGEGSNSADIQIRHWMEREVIRWACWNGTKLSKVFPTSAEIAGSSESHRDVAWFPRDTGVFYQNFMLGSTIENPETVWRSSEPLAHDRHETL